MAIPHEQLVAMLGGLGVENRNHRHGISLRHRGGRAHLEPKPEYKKREIQHLMGQLKITEEEARKYIPDL